MKYRIEYTARLTQDGKPVYHVWETWGWFNMCECLQASFKTYFEAEEFIKERKRTEEKSSQI